MCCFFNRKSFNRENSYKQLGFADKNTRAAGYVPIPSSFFDNEKVIDLDTGSLHSVFLTESHNLYIAGCNSNYELVSKMPDGYHVQLQKFNLANIEQPLSLDQQGEEEENSFKNKSKSLANGVISVQCGTYCTMVQRVKQEGCLFVV